MVAMELFSPTEIGAVAGVPMRSIYKAIEHRLPAGFVVRRNRQRLLTRWGAICVLIDHQMPKHLPVAVRKEVYARIKGAKPPRAITCKHGILQYVVDVRSTANKMEADIARYRRAAKLIVEDPSIQAGAATFKGTRILVHQIADLVAQGATEAELREDYPRLTREMIASATIYAKSHPRRGRPRKPLWRRHKPIRTTVIKRRNA
jgi:uncharacterized protein (DUF433 family)